MNEWLVIYSGTVEPKERGTHKLRVTQTWSWVIGRWTMGGEKGAKQVWNVNADK
jgi:hypothetical protein